MSHSDSDLTTIVVFGTESTGKTTLARALAQHFQVPWAEEYVRFFWALRHGDVRAEDLASIARGQLDNERRAEQAAYSLLICDTDLLTNTLWADLLFPGHCPDWVRSLAEYRATRYSLYLLCDADIDFVDDGLRSFPDPDKRRYCRRLWRETLTRRHLPFIDIRGSFAERLTTAIQAVENQCQLDGNRLER